MNKIITSILLVLALLPCMSAGAANVSFTAQAPRQVIQGNRFQISYVLQNADGSGFVAPEVQGAAKVYGPAESTSYSSQWVNGVSSSSSTVSYVMTYKATKAGTYKVGSATVMADGKRMTTKPFTIEILPPDKSASSASQSSGGSVRFDDPNTQEAGRDVSSKDLFVRISMSKQAVYEQEAVVCSIKLYTKYQISSFMCTLQPSFTGFLIEDLPISPTLNQVERVNGENYMVAELKRCILFPQQSGKLSITSGNYDVTVIQYERYRSMFGMVQEPVEKQLKVKSNSASVVITPLPTPKPATFSGAVGSFTLSATVNPTSSYKTLEAATYTYTVRGSGNIKYIKAPQIDFPSQFDVYDPQTKNNAKPSGNSVAGAISYEYTFIPQFVGKYTIPQVQFTYFNPEQKKYVTLHTEQYDISVAKGKGGTGARKDGGIQQKNTDILHIKTGDLHLHKKQSLYVDLFTYWLWYIIPTLATVALLYYYRKQIKQRSNLQLMKSKRAKKVAWKRLKLAGKYLKANDSNHFYAEMLKAVWGYLSDKLAIPVSELNRDNIKAELLDYGVEETEIDALIAQLDKCEFAQYTPTAGDGEMQNVYNSIANIMDGIENTKRK